MKTNPIPFNFFEDKIKNFITLPVWDSGLQQEVLVTKDFDDWIDSPYNMNIEAFGLHVLNTLRMTRKLAPLRHKLSTK